MKTTMLTMFAAGAFCLAAREDDVKKELEKYTGSWTAVSVEHDGKKLSEDDVKTVKLTVKGEKYTYRIRDQVIEGTHTVSPGKKPKQIDAVRSKGPDAGKSLKGIYELDDDTFKVCFAPVGKDRPADFETKEGDGRRLMTFKRQKP